MSLNEQTFASINTMPNIIREHFDRMNAKIKVCDEKSTKEIKALSKFLNDLHFIGSAYEKSLFKLCEDFQQQMKHFIHDDKLTQYFQLVINSLLRHGDTIQKQYEKVSGIRNTFGAIDKDFKMTTENVIESVGSNLAVYKEKSQEFEYLYKKYIKSSISLTNQSNSGQKSSRRIERTSSSDLNEFTSSRDAEDQALLCYTDVENLFQYNIANLKRRINDCYNKEMNVKHKVKQSALVLIKTFAIDLKTEYQPKIDSLEISPENFRCYFDHLEKENSLEFNPKITLNNFELKFFPFHNFMKLDSIFDQPYAKTLSNKVTSLGKIISPRIKIYIDLLLDYIYKANIEFSKEIIEEINFIMSNVKTSEYLIYNLILKKSLILFEKPFTNITLKRDQFKNIQPISQYFFLNYLSGNGNEINCEAIFNFLKFTLTVFNEQKICFIESLSRIVLVNDARFWGDLMSFIYQHYKQNSNLESFVSANLSNNPNLINGIRNLVGVIKTNLATPQGKDTAYTKAFNDVAYFIFKLRLDFETITDILLVLAPKAGVTFEFVKTILQKNQDLFLSQISGQNFSISEQEKSLAKISKSLNRSEKIFLVCKKCVQYLNEPSQIYKIITLNKFIYGDRKRIFIRALLNFDLEKSPVFRQAILRTKIEPGMAKERLVISNFQDVDTIISLDVKRTFCDNKDFNPSKLELILKNISHPDVGRFSYYQGLNYIASYFYVLFEGDEILTYNFVISIMHNYFFNYVDSDLKNLRKLFFCLKRLIQMYLPVLYNYLENEQKLDMDIIFASWCLTLFTTITQSFPKSKQLDEVIDIFVSKGWPGFFKIVIVILDLLQEKILNLGYEDILIVLSDLAKTNFIELINIDISNQQLAFESQDRSREKGLRLENDLGEKTLDSLYAPFSFKQKIKKFTKINKTSLICYQNDYYKILEQIDEFWHKINKKIRLSS
jgi:hypothetical protein